MVKILFFYFYINILYLKAMSSSLTSRASGATGSITITVINDPVLPLSPGYPENKWERRTDSCLCSDLPSLWLNTHSPGRWRQVWRTDTLKSNIIVRTAAVGQGSLCLSCRGMHHPQIFLTCCCFNLNCPPKTRRDVQAPDIILFCTLI